MQDDIHILISGYFGGNLTASEHQELKNQIESNADARKIFEDYRLLWEESGQKILLKPIDVESAMTKVKLRLFFRKNNIFQFLQRAVAVLFLAGLFSTAYIYYHNYASIQNQKEQPVIVQEVSTIFGIRSKFQLSDGTKICLNSNSRLIFPVEFKGNSRNVELIGEAYFEVTQNTEKPFIVKTREINLKVLGTTFNLQAYPESNEISATLINGKIILERESNGITMKLNELKPMERAVFKSDSKSLDISSEEDADKFIAWKDGKLVFSNDPVEHVAEKLGNWYNVAVKISNNKLKRYRFTATFTDEPIEQVLDLLSKSSPIKYSIKKASRLSDNSYSKREIILN